MAEVKRTIWENAFATFDPQINAEGVHLWPLDRHLPVDVRHIILSGRQPFRMNRHDYLELLYVHSGELVWQVQDRFYTQKVDALFVMGTTLYHRVTEYSHPQVKGTVLVLLPDLIRAASALGDDTEYLAPFLMQDAAFPHVVPADTGIPAQVLDLLKRIHAELPTTSDRAGLCVKTYVKMILILLVNHYASHRGTIEVFSRNQQALDRLRPLFEFLESHYGEPVGVHDAASVVGMSKSHFMRFFKQVTGQSFVNYLNHFRIAKAQVTLALPDKSIAQVSQETGFCDQSYFGLVFRRLTHMTPLQYRHSLNGAGGTEPPSPEVPVTAGRPAAQPSRSAR